METQMKITTEEQQLKYQRDKLYQDIHNLDVIMKNTNQQIDMLTKKIQTLCIHEYESEHVYGERTTYKCKKCGHWY